jgi:hypothetical protein
MQTQRGIPNQRGRTKQQIYGQKSNIRAEEERASEGGQKAPRLSLRLIDAEEQSEESVEREGIKKQRIRGEQWNIVAN